MDKSIFLDFINKLLSFPLWIKQSIYLKLSEDLNTYLSDEFLNMHEGELFHLYKPELSERGKEELMTTASQYSEDIYKFLDCCLRGMSLIEIAIENSFTMEEVSKAFTFCKKTHLFSKEVPNLVSAIAGFIAGNYRTGEYFIRAGKMTIEQLDEVLDKQQELKDKGQHVFFAELMIQMGMIQEIDMKSIIFMKEEACKRFSINPDDMPTLTLEQEKFDLRVENTKLKEENDILKEKINAILSYIKDHKEKEINES